MENSPELRPGRFVHAGAAGQPVDPNEVVRVVVGWLNEDIRRREDNALVVPAKEDAPLRQWNQFVPAGNKLALRVKGNIGERPPRQAFASWKWKRICQKGGLVHARIRSQRWVVVERRLVELDRRDQDS